MKPKLTDIIIQAHYDNGYQLLKKLIKRCGLDNVQESLNSIAAKKLKEDAFAKKFNTPETLMDLLIETGLSVDIAFRKTKQLTDKYGLEQCQRQIDYWPERIKTANNVVDKKEFLIKSIQEDWGEPVKTETN